MGLGKGWSQAPGCGHGEPCGTGGSRARGRAFPASPLPCAPGERGRLLAVSMLSSGLSLGRQEGGEEQGGTSQGREGGGGEVKQPAGHLTVLAWRGAAAGRAWGAGEGAWDPAPGGHRGERGCSWSPWGLEGCGGSPTVLSTLAELMLQAGRRVRHQATYFLLRCCLAPRSPCPPSGLRSCLAANSRSPAAAPGPWLVPWPGPGWSALAERGWGCRPSRRPRACPAVGLSPVVPHPAGAAVPGGGGAGAGPRGAILRAVPAPARRHGGALRATGRLRAGLGPGLRGGFAAALLPYHPARESRERGAGAGTLLPGPDAWAPSAPAREPQGLPDAPLGAVPPAWPCSHPARPLRSQPRAFRR